MTKNLFDAALNGARDILENYKNKTPDVAWDNIKDEQGNVLIAIAASKGKLHIIEYLFNSGASLNIKNNAGKVDLQIAFEGNHPNTARGLFRLYQKAGITSPISEEELGIKAA